MSRPRPPLLVSGSAIAALALLPFQRPNVVALVVEVLGLDWPEKKIEALPAVTLGDLALGAAFAIFLAWVIRSKEWRRLWDLPVGVAAYMAVVLVAGISAGQMRPLAKELLQSFEFFVAAFIIFSCALSHPDSRRSAATVLLEVTGVIVLAALVQYLGSGPAHTVRAGFLHNNALGLYLALMLPVALGAALAEERVWVRTALLIGCAVGPVVMLSGGFFLAAVAGMLVAAALYDARAMWATAAASVVVILLVVPSMPRGVGRQFDAIDVFATPPASDDPVVTARYKRWGAAVKLIGDKPVLGVGPGRFTSELQNYYRTGPAGKPSGDTSVPANWNVSADEPGTFSAYAVVACETGLVGLAALAMVFLAILAAGARCRSGVRGFDRGLLCGAMGGIVAVVIGGTFGQPLVRGIWPVLVFVMALVRTIAAETRPADDPGPDLQ